MNTYHFKKSTILFLFLSIAISFAAYSQVGGWKPDLEKDASEALQKMLKDVPKLKTFYDKAYGYVVFPKVTKVGIGIGGAGGKGIVYREHKAIATSGLKQGTVGLQLGGQEYSEVIFFENKEAFDHFKNGNLKFDAQASAVAITAGASVDTAYHGGVAIFTRVKGGLMFEASIGGQYFTYKSNN